MKAVTLLRLSATCLAAGLACAPALADGSKSVNMVVRVLVNAPPPCSIKGSTVSFGKMPITKVDGVNYTKTVGYTLSCDSRLSDLLRLQIQGTSVNINGEQVLDTGVAGYGIRLQLASDKSLLQPGTANWFNFNYAGNNAPVLEAVPVKTASTVATGSFSVSATLVVDYQ
ncbi:fimbrial protein [Salmonella enterica subsp. enterica]|nr:fimbrial protein [Salmonella enterica subsp. enterica]ECA8970352.1 fimbrial protein [Salmonella enterica subsp. enterica serovar Omuna]EEJ7235705.1 fimbrial protein [Salmonella enterica subsp. salamae]EGZ4335973.1 fimbrial protein [Salmonella enterica subsp. enterica serovar Texas]HAV1237944.1 fimbrial protein [Salmonella enterica]